MLVSHFSLEHISDVVGAAIDSPGPILLGLYFNTFYLCLSSGRISTLLTMAVLPTLYLSSFNILLNITSLELYDVQIALEMHYQDSRLDIQALCLSNNISFIIRGT